MSPRVARWRPARATGERSHLSLVSSAVRGVHWRRPGHSSPIEFPRRHRLSPAHALQPPSPPHPSTLYFCPMRANRQPPVIPGLFVGRVCDGRHEALPERVIHPADQLPSPSARFAANPQLSGKYGGHTLNLHQFVRDGVMLLGRLVGVDGYRIALAPDLQENLTNADQASEDFKHGVDEFVRRTGMDVPEPEPDPVDEVRSDAGRHAPATLDLQAAGITTVIWATGYGFDYSWVHLPVFDAYGFPVQQRVLSLDSVYKRATK